MSCKAYTHTGDTLCSYQFFNRIDKRQKSYIVNTHFYYTKEPKAKNNNNLVSETMFKVSQTFFVDYQIKKSTISYIPPRFSEWFTVLSNYQACSINLDVYRDKYLFARFLYTLVTVFYKYSNDLLALFLKHSLAVQCGI